MATTVAISSKSVATTGAAYVYAESAAGGVVRHEPGALIKLELPTALSETSSGTAYGYGETAGGVAVKINPAFVNIKDYGAIGDGASHPLSGVYASLAEAQAVYPHATSLTDELDWAAIQAAWSLGVGVMHPDGTYIVNQPLEVANNTHAFGVGKATIKTTVAPTMGTGHAQVYGSAKTGFRITGLYWDQSPITTFSGGYRSMFFDGCSDYDIEHNYITTPGAAVAHTAGTRFRVRFNEAVIAASDATAHHDGIFDHWDGCSYFQTEHNIVRGNSIGRYAFLATGQSTALVAAACHNFSISHNQAYSVTLVGIWVNGRNGVNYNVKIDNNLINTVTTYHGLRVSDCYNGTVIGNIIVNSGAAGITLEKEATYGAYGVRGFVVGFNTVTNANTGLSAGADGAAIRSSSAENDKNAFVHNKVRGTNHTYSMVNYGTTNRLIGKDWAVGTTGGISDSGTGTIFEGVQVYTPTVTGTANVTTITSYANTAYTNNGESVEVWGTLVITPTAGASTTTTATISLPVASNLGSANVDLSGIAASGFGTVAEIYADTANDLAIIRFPAPGTSAYTFRFRFNYKII